MNKTKKRKVGRPKSRFCPKGHDTFLIGRGKGRDKEGSCMVCKKDYAATHYVPRPKKQFCPKGHDTFIFGRTKGYCNGCLKPVSLGLRQKKYKPKQQFCPNGHNKDIVGKTSYGACQKCFDVYHIKYDQEHKKERNIKRTKRRKKDINYKLSENLRARLRAAIKGNFKSGSAVKDLGCSIEFLKNYIESKFYSNMTWDNWGKVWELDHIKALWKFDLADREQFKKAVNYQNLQPLTIEDHRKKTNKETKEHLAKKRNIV